MVPSDEPGRPMAAMPPKQLPLLALLLLQLARSMSLRNRRVVVVGGAVGRED